MGGKNWATVIVVRLVTVKIHVQFIIKSLGFSIDSVGKITCSNLSNANYCFIFQSEMGLLLF